MKLIIDIPEDVIAYVKETYIGDDVLYCAVKYGTPFNSVIDDIKAEIADIYVGYRHGYEIRNDALEIIDKHIGKEKE